MKTKIIIFTFLLVFGLMVAGVSAGPRAQWMGKGDRLLWYRDLNLTEEQKRKVDDLKETLRNDIVPLRNEMVRKKTELKLLWMDANPDAEKIKSKQKEIRDLRAQIEDRLTDFRLALQQILTPEQRSKIISFKSRGGSRFYWDKRPIPHRGRGHGALW